MGAFLIVLREAFEASLIVGLILAFLARNHGSAEHRRAVWLGVAAAVATSVLAGAVLFAAFGELSGGQEAVFEGVAMLLACAVLTWMVFWMRAQARSIGANLRAQVSRAVLAGGGLALAAVAFIGVMREGLETALVLFGSVGDDGGVQTLVGSTLGLVAAVGLGVAFYSGALRLDLRKFFLVTGLLVIGLGAYLLYGGLHELGEAGAGEGFEVAAPILGLLFAGVFTWLYLRDASGVPADGPAGEKPAVPAVS